MKFGKFFFRCANSIVELTVLTCILLLAGFGCYGIWDSNQIYQEADKARYEEYRPGEETLSFEELRRLNEEVFGWLTVYGTNIDYPLVQAEDNEKYVNTDASGEFSLSGALFLDYRNQQDFSDFNSIIYGHHMNKERMFGELYKFENQEYFDEHQYGEIFYDNDWHGIEFFAFVKADAYDRNIYSPAVSEIEQREAYLDYLEEKALCTREMNISTGEHIILLSTCTSDITNGRHILVGKITDKIHKNPFKEESRKK